MCTIDMDDYSEKLITLIAEGKAKQYNPICVYGKRYLVEQFSDNVQLACLKTTPNTRICCLSGETFVKRLIHSVRGGYTDTFRELLRIADMLVFTDIEEIQGKQVCMWEFFSLFDHYYEQGKMIIIGSSVPYSDLISLEDRVLTQLQGGLIVELKDDPSDD